MKNCPICEAQVDDNAVKCPTCGYDFPIESPAENITEGEATAAPKGEYNYQQNYNYNVPQGKYCPRCGNWCDPNAVICVKCGLSFGQIPQPKAADDTASTGLKVLCVLFPIVALILYLIEKDKKPNAAKEYGKFGLIGLAVNVGLSIITSILSSLLSTVFYGLFAGTGYGYDYYFRILASIIPIL